MRSGEREWRPQTPAEVERKERKAEFLRRMSGSLEIPSTPPPSTVDFKEYPQYLRRNALASEYTKERHLGAVKAI